MNERVACEAFIYFARDKIEIDNSDSMTLWGTLNGRFGFRGRLLNNVRRVSRRPLYNIQKLFFLFVTVPTKAEFGLGLRHSPLYGLILCS